LQHPGGVENIVEKDTLQCSPPLLTADVDTGKYRKILTLDRERDDLDTKDKGIHSFVLLSRDTPLCRASKTALRGQDHARCTARLAELGGTASTFVL
jgi:hypothetical protein